MDAVGDRALHEVARGRLIDDSEHPCGALMRRGESLGEQFVEGCCAQRLRLDDIGGNVGVTEPDEMPVETSR